MDAQFFKKKKKKKKKKKAFPSDCTSVSRNAYPSECTFVSRNALPIHCASASLKALPSLCECSRARISKSSCMRVSLCTADVYKRVHWKMYLDDLRASADIEISLHFRILSFLIICILNSKQVLLLTADMSKYLDKRNSVDPDQTPQSAASDQGLHCSLRSVCPNN